MCEGRYVRRSLCAKRSVWYIRVRFISGVDITKGLVLLNADACVVGGGGGGGGDGGGGGASGLEHTAGLGGKCGGGSAEAVCGWQTREQKRRGGERSGGEEG